MGGRDDRRGRTGELDCPRKELELGTNSESEIKKEGLKEGYFNKITVSPKFLHLRLSAPLVAQMNESKSRKHGRFGC